MSSASQRSDESFEQSEQISKELATKNCEELKNEVDKQQLGPETKLSESMLEANLDYFLEFDEVKDEEEVVLGLKQTKGKDWSKCQTQYRTCITFRDTRHESFFLCATRKF